MRKALFVNVGNAYFCSMETTRQHKIAKLLQRDLGEILQREVPPLAPGVMVTITKVQVSPDLSVAKAYLSVFGTAKKDEVVAKANKISREIRGFLGKRVRHQLRIIPELQFFEDDSLDYIENIDKLLNDK